MVKNSRGLLVHKTLKPAYLKNKFVNLADFLNVNNDVIIFGQTDIQLFDFKYRGSTAVVLLVLLCSEISYILLGAKPIFRGKS